MVKVVQSMRGVRSNCWPVMCGLLVLASVGCDPPTVKKPLDGGTDRVASSTGTGGATDGSAGGGGDGDGTGGGDVPGGGGGGAIGTGGDGTGGNVGSGGQIAVPPECASAADCANPMRPVCQRGACVPCGPAPDVTCPSPKVCNTMTGACVACVSETQCTTATKPFCVNNDCVACGASMETACSATRTPGKPVCNTTTGACVACVKESDCPMPNQPLCVGNSCVRCGSSPEATCSATRTPGKTKCEMMSGACVECLVDSECPGTRPFCDGNACIACSAKPAITCAMREPMLPVCDASKGDCVQCLTSANCPAEIPVCTPERTCRKCQQHTECAASGVCLLNGRCAAQTDVIYVKAGNCAGTGEKTNPFCRPQDAVERLGSAGETRRIVVLSGSLPTFQITTGFGSPVTFFGQDMARVTGSSNPDVVRVSGNAVVELNDIALGLGDGQVGLRVANGAQVTARQLVVDGTPTSGVGIVVAGSTLTLDRAIVRNAGGGGIRTTDSAFAITNSVFDRNGTIGVDLGAAPGKTQSFSYNTVLSHSVGLICTGSYPRGLILFGNTEATSGACTLPVDAFTDLDPQFNSTRPYRLTASSACCVNRGKAGEAPAHDIDGQMRDAMPDLGADEL